MASGNDKGEKERGDRVYRIIGLTTLIAIIAGAGAWLITEIFLDMSRSDALYVATRSFGIVLIVGVVLSLVVAFKKE